MHVLISVVKPFLLKLILPDTTVFLWVSRNTSFKLLSNKCISESHVSDILGKDYVFETPFWPLTASRAAAAESPRRVLGESGEGPRGVIGRGWVSFWLLFCYFGRRLECKKHVSRDTSRII